MSGVQTSILNSPEQNRHAFDPPYEANDLVALAFARYPYPEFFFGWTPSSGGTVMFARTDRLPPWIARRRDEPMSIRWRSCAIRRRSRHCAGGSKQTSPQRRRYSVFDTSIRRRPVPSRRAAHLRGQDQTTARPCVRRGHQSRVGPRPLLQRHPSTGGADRRKCQRDGLSP